MTSFTSIDLATGWEFKRSDDQSDQAWLPVIQVPTVVHLDLIHHKLIPDPSRDLNELDVQWVGEKGWTYRYTFTAPQKQEDDRIALVFEGLDTFVRVQLNGMNILQSENMFVPQHIDVTHALDFSASNMLGLVFDSALLRARDIRREHPEHNYFGHLGEVERLGTRKAPYHWGWDWGPKLMTAGLWRPIRLEKYSCRVVDVRVDYKLNTSLKTCSGTISAQVDGNFDSTARLALRNPGGDVVFQETCSVSPAGYVVVPFEIQGPELWFPHGYGLQLRYYLDAEISAGGKILHTLTRRVGFRQADLIQETDVYGKSFYFRVNGVDVFAGGNCWIPGDNFTPRIWGGGIYEEDVFYDTCDELGVLVWQDFLFACGSYPTFPAYLQSVEAEARANLRRLRHHPSIIIYSGGNENYYIQETYGLDYDYEGDKDPQRG